MVTNRDEWVYDFDHTHLGSKVRAFINEYEESRAEHGGKNVDDSILGTKIKWTRDLKRQLRLDLPNVFDRAMHLPDAVSSIHEKATVFQSKIERNAVSDADDISKRQPRSEQNNMLFWNFIKQTILSVGRLMKYIRWTCLKRHSACPSTDIPPTASKSATSPSGASGSSTTTTGRSGARHSTKWLGPTGITAEDIFAYAYAVLHDPAYRHDYRVDLLREFPPDCPSTHDFGLWRDMGRELLDLHVRVRTIGTVAPGAD